MFPAKINVHNLIYVDRKVALGTVGRNVLWSSLF